MHTKYLDSIIVNEVTYKDFQVEIGNMDYGMEIDGILGTLPSWQAYALINSRQTFALIGEKAFFKLGTVGNSRG
ncbi:hypothetical protein FHR92_000275 [Fontibacillus solani]|uniref:Uncharacterized protein n=1 Tax=Fontibacillus solani TaxID=1572857 RepID=A0A7W3SPH9_9BACL|nr:hypothetical protein [Fontibacillus solani]